MLIEHKQNDPRVDHIYINFFYILNGWEDKHETPSLTFPLCKNYASFTISYCNFTRSSFDALCYQGNKTLYYLLCKLCGFIRKFKKCVHVFFMHTKLLRLNFSLHLYKDHQMWLMKLQCYMSLTQCKPVMFTICKLKLSK